MAVVFDRIRSDALHGRSVDSNRSLGSRIAHRLGRGMSKLGSRRSDDYQDDHEEDDLENSEPFLVVSISNTRNGKPLQQPEDCFIPFKKSGAGTLVTCQ